MSEIPLSVWSNLTGVSLALAIVFLLFYFLITGKLRTNLAVQEIRQDRDDRVAEAKQQVEDFKEALRVSEEARAVQTEITREALEASRISEDVLRSLRVALEIAQRGDKS